MPKKQPTSEWTSSSVLHFYTINEFENTWWKKSQDAPNCSQSWKAILRFHPFLLEQHQDSFMEIFISKRLQNTFNIYRGWSFVWVVQSIKFFFRTCRNRSDIMFKATDKGSLWTAIFALWKKRLLSKDSGRFSNVVEVPKVKAKFSIY